jgi:GH15 family glucan-1,4-alpha-glucosidase
VEALARAGQQEPKYLCEAQRMFEDILGYANHLGLFSEEIDLSGRALGNFPQAFTHLSLISSAFNLDRFLDL